MRLERITPVILCGGAGRRLHPLSRPAGPKPFLRIGSERSLLQETILRVRACGESVLALHESMLAKAEDHLSEIGQMPRRIILEPCGRNTAPALAAAACTLAEDDIMLVLPSDHRVENPAALLSAVARAAPYAARGRIVTFGITPTRIETGFGHIRRGPAAGPGLYHVDQFIEKPPRPLAASLAGNGACFWNSGIFLLSAATARIEMARFAPEILAAGRRAVLCGRNDGKRLFLSPDFAACPPLSIDIALMEHSTRTLVMPVALAWDDLGTWPALARVVFSHKPSRNPLSLPGALPTLGPCRKYPSFLMSAVRAPPNPAPNKAPFMPAGTD